MDKIYIGKRASGKTTLLIKKSAETGAVIVAPTHAACAYIEEMARTMNLNITKPITVAQFLYEKGRNTECKVLVDGLQFLLNELGVDAATVTDFYTENISENTDGEYIEELKAMIPKALYDRAIETVCGDLWTTCLECVQEMANAWEILNGENLVWVPGHYETKDFTNSFMSPLSYPYYHLCYYDKNGCYDEDFEQKDKLLSFLEAMYLRNIVDKDSPEKETVRLFYHEGRFETYEITLTSITDTAFPWESYDGVITTYYDSTITRVYFNGVDGSAALDVISSFIKEKVSRPNEKVLHISFGKKAICKLEVRAVR